MNRYHPQRLPRPLAAFAALAFATAMLAGVHAEAKPAREALLPAVFTGEVTAHGPVYRLPGVRVEAYRVFELALPDLIDRAFDDGRRDEPHA